MKKNIYIMYAISFLHGMVFYGSIATLYRQVQGVSVFQITIIESISLVLCLLFELPWGIVADRIGYKRTMLCCCLLYFISKVIFWQATDYLGFLFERIILSVVISGLSGVDTGILYLSSAEEGSQNTFGVYNSLGTSGLLLASFVFSIFIGANYKLSALLTVISYGIAAILSMFLVEVKPAEKNDDKFNKKEFINILGNIFKNRHLLMFLIAVALLNETHQTLTVFLNQLQYTKAGMPVKLIGLVYIVVTVAGLCSSLSAKVTAKIGTLRLIKLCYISAMVACIALALTSSALVSIGSILLLRIAFSLFQPLQSDLQNKQVSWKNRATCLSIFAVVINSIGVCTNVVFGALADINVSLAFWAGAVLCVIGFMLMLIWAKGAKSMIL